MMIFVRSLTFNTIALEVDLSDSLAGLRRRIQVRSIRARSAGYSLLLCRVRLAA